MRLVLVLALVSCCLGAVLRNVQVAQPVDTRGLRQLCRQELLHHVRQESSGAGELYAHHAQTFGNSYGKPAKVDYSPAESCGPPSSWQRLALEWTAMSDGTQYDRLSTLWLHHVEILRTSTAEPTRDGIIWTFGKDVTQYAPLFSRAGRLLLDLGNLLDPSRNLTGEFAINLILLVYGSGRRAIDGEFQHALSRHAAQHAVMLPISTQSLHQANYFESHGSSQLIAPQNAVMAFAELYISGAAREEFWYSNTPNEVLSYLPQGLIGHGPFREVQLLIDGLLAGFVTPFPVIYTGGVIPTAWRPIASYGAFDEPTYVLDLTPFLPLLCDNAAHTYELRTIGHTGNTSINDNWFVSANVRFVTGQSPARTTGRILHHFAIEKPAVNVVAEVHDQSVRARTATLRQLDIEAEVTFGDGTHKTVSVHQSTSFVNTQVYKDGANAQEVWQQIRLEAESRHGSAVVLKDDATFLLSMDTVWQPKQLKLEARIDQTFSRRQSLPQEAFAGSRAHSIWSSQAAVGVIELNATTGRVIKGYGETSQSFNFQLLGELKPSYWRSIEAKNASIIRDRQGGAFASIGSHAMEPQDCSADLQGGPPPRWLERFISVRRS